MRQTLAIFGSAISEKNSPEYQEAEEIGKLIGQNGLDVICGGYGGLMEAVCKGCSSVGGACSGIGLRAFDDEPNQYIDSFNRVTTLGERLNFFGKRADAFLALPGGIGTIAEVTSFWDITKGRIAKVELPILLYGALWIPFLEVLRKNFIIQPSFFKYVTPISNRDELETELKKIAIQRSEDL